MLAPVRLCANVFRNLSETQRSLRSCETMLPRSGAWLSFYWLYPTKLNPP
jgi:hypothetical protein